MKTIYTAEREQLHKIYDRKVYIRMALGTAEPIRDGVDVLTANLPGLHAA